MDGAATPVDRYQIRPWAQQLEAKVPICFAIETFGPERSMFETNYPEDRHLTDFVVLWNTYKRIAAGFSADERSWVFEKAARSVYNV